MVPLPRPQRAVRRLQRERQQLPLGRLPQTPARHEPRLDGHPPALRRGPRRGGRDPGQSAVQRAAEVDHLQPGEGGPPLPDGGGADVGDLRCEQRSAAEERGQRTRDRLCDLQPRLVGPGHALFGHVLRVGQHHALAGDLSAAVAVRAELALVLTAHLPAPAGPALPAERDWAWPRGPGLCAAAFRGRSAGTPAGSLAKEDLDRDQPRVARGQGHDLHLDGCETADHELLRLDRCEEGCGRFKVVGLTAEQDGIEHTVGETA